MPDGELVINHLTRMRAPHICVAGLDSQLRHVRPQLPGRRWERGDLPPGGPFRIGELVGLGPYASDGSPPEIEDVRLAPGASVVAHGRLHPAKLWAMLKSVASSSMESLFGDDLTVFGSGSASIPEGCGLSSLGVLEPADTPRLSIADNGQVKIRFTDSRDQRLNLQVTDVRLCDGFFRPVPALVRAAAERLAAADPTLLSVGVGRAWSFGDRPREHWAQVNNLHFEQYLDDHPVFRAHDSA